MQNSSSVFRSVNIPNILTTKGDQGRRSSSKYATSSANTPGETLGSESGLQNAFHWPGSPFASKPGQLQQQQGQAQRGISPAAQPTVTAPSLHVNQQHNAAVIDLTAQDEQTEVTAPVPQQSPEGIAGTNTSTSAQTQPPQTPLGLPDENVTNNIKGGGISAPGLASSQEASRPTSRSKLISDGSVFQWDGSAATPVTTKQSTSLTRPRSNHRQGQPSTAVYRAGLSALSAKISQVANRTGALSQDPEPQSPAGITRPKTSYAAPPVTTSPVSRPYTAAVTSRGSVGSAPMERSPDNIFRPRTVPQTICAGSQGYDAGVPRVQNEQPGTAIQPADVWTRPATADDTGIARSKMKHPKGAFTELLQATRKTFAAGMGEWDLQALDWCNPTFNQRLLQGPIGPEALKKQYGLQESDILRLYRLLYWFSSGFCTAVMEATSKAVNREQLLESLIQAYAQLWDEALGVAFQSEITDVLRTKTNAVTAMELIQSQLEHVQAERDELKAKLSKFARGNIDNMLAFRFLSDKARTTEGQAAMLSSTNDMLNIKLTGAELAREELNVAAKTAAEKQAVAEGQAMELAASLSRAKAALKEQQAVCAQQAKQIKQLEELLCDAKKRNQAMTTAQHDAKMHAQHLQARYDALQAQANEKLQAYKLLHTNWQVKDQELEETRALNSKLQSKVSEMEDTHATATQQIQDAKEAERMAQSRWELGRQQLEEVTATNKKLAARNLELVQSYWPLVARLNEAESRSTAAQSSCEQAIKERDGLQAQVAKLTARIEAIHERQSSAQSLQQQATEALQSQQIPDALLVHLSTEGGEQVRTFIQAAAGRVSELTQQLIRLVDVQATSAIQLQHAEMERDKLQQQLVALQQQNNIPVNSLSPHTSTTVTAVQHKPDTATEGGAHNTQGAELSLPTNLQSTKQDRWLQQASQQMSAASLSIEELLSQDPDSPPDLRGTEVHDLKAAVGRAAQAAGLVGETCEHIVASDMAWDRLASALDRLMKWSQATMQHRVQLKNVEGIHRQLSEAMRQKATLEAQLSVLQQDIQDCKERAAIGDQRAAEAQTAITAAAARAALATEAEARAQQCQLELGKLQEKHVLMEQEYWAVKSQLLEAQLNESKVKAACDQAKQDAEEAVKRAAQAEVEMQEHRKQCYQLESEVVGLKAWVRTMQTAEVEHRQLLMTFSECHEQLHDTQEQLAALKALTSGNAGGSDVLRVRDEAMQRLRDAVTIATTAQRNSEDSKKAMQAQLAEARRAAESSEDALQRSIKDMAIQVERTSRKEAELEAERQLSAELKTQLLQLQLQLKQQEAAKSLALSALVDVQVAANGLQTDKPQQ